ncbi:MAG: Uncharacterized protein CEO12_395 [Parcubacteria group bacterium Gr01-1014_46]|nr:MAG: Uncharacterized protein CEO12_395 [Parcubacteria group bacterium Gr01-1014_46]
MADEKKPGGDKPGGDKPAPAPVKDPLTELILVLFALFVLVTALNSVTSFFSGSRVFSSGWKGFTERGLILSYTNPISSLDNPLNTKFIVTSKEADLYDSPGGRKISTRYLGDKGTIIGGPVSIDGGKYWQVKFEDGTTGWISEDDIASIEGVGPNIFVRSLLFLWKLVSYLKLILIIFSLVLIAWLVYLSNRIVKLRKEEGEKLYPSGIPDEFNETKVSNPRWEVVEKNLLSSSENDWRQAIMEADIILVELLENMSLPGETVADKLKAVERSDFTTIDFAWEAHKVRNQVAHEGASFALSQREAKRVIELYKAVFEEFHMI